MRDEGLGCSARVEISLKYFFFNFFIIKTYEKKHATTRRER